MPRCPGYQPDFSRFTLTGRALTTFESRAAQSTVSANVEVYASRSDALGEWRLSVTPPWRPAASPSWFVGSSASPACQSPSARVKPAPNLAEASAGSNRSRSGHRIPGRCRSTFHGLFLRQGPTIAALYTTALTKPVPGLESPGALSRGSHANRFAPFGHYLVSTETKGRDTLVTQEVPLSRHFSLATQTTRAPSLVAVLCQTPGDVRQATSFKE